MSKKVHMFILCVKEEILPIATNCVFPNWKILENTKHMLEDAFSHLKNISLRKPALSDQNIWKEVFS